jgi:glycosyltransferase involved in cell wall biosynthesis
MGHTVDAIWAEDLPHRIKHWNLHYLLELPAAYWTAIAQRLHEKTYDVIHANQAHCFWAAKQFARSGQKGVFVHRSHGLDDQLDFTMDLWNAKLGVQKRRGLKRYSGWLIDYLLHRHDRLAAEYVDGTIVSTSIDGEFLKEYHGVPENRIAVIPQAPPDHFRQTEILPISADRLKRVLFVGTGVSKGIHAVADVINQCSKAGCGMEFTWVCPAAERGMCQSLLSDQALARVNFLAWVAQDQFMDVYDQHGILLVPSFFEGFCKAFLEGMSRGMVVVATKVGGMRDLLHDDVNGYVVNPNDGRSIAQRLTFLQGHLERAKRVAEKAREHAISYSWARVGKETAEFYEYLLLLKGTKSE